MPANKLVDLVYSVNYQYVIVWILILDTYKVKCLKMTIDATVRKRYLAHSKIDIKLFTVFSLIDTHTTYISHTENQQVFFKHDYTWHIIYIAFCKQKQNKNKKKITACNSQSIQRTDDADFAHTDSLPNPFFPHIIYIASITRQRN